MSIRTIITTNYRGMQVVSHRAATRKEFIFIVWAVKLPTQ